MASRSSLALLACLAAAAALCAPAILRAEPVSAAFQPVLVELNARDAGLGTPATKEEKRQRKALDRALRSLEMTSTALSGDLRIAKKMTAVLDRGFPSDGELGSLLDALVDGLQDEVRTARDQVQTLVATLEEGPPRAKAESRLSLADDALAAAPLEEVRSKRVAVLARAEKKVGQAEAAARKGDPAAPSGNATMAAEIDGVPWRANASLGAGVSGAVLVDGSTGGVRDLLVRGRMYLYTPNPDPKKDPTFDGIRTVEIRVTSLHQDLAPGTYDIGPGASFTAAATYIDEDAAGKGPVFHATSGSITLQSVTGSPLGAGGKGTFGFTGWDPKTEATRSIALGVFDVSGLQRTSR